MWCKLVLPAVRTSAGCHVHGTDQASTVAVGPIQCTSSLQVLAALVRGAKKDVLKPYIKVDTQDMPSSTILLYCIHCMEVNKRGGTCTHGALIVSL